MLKLEEISRCDVRIEQFVGVDAHIDPEDRSNLPRLLLEEKLRHKTVMRWKSSSLIFIK